MRCAPQPSGPHAVPEPARTRRPAGLLREAILRVLDEGGPMRAARIHEAVRRGGLAIPMSLFFRDLGKLVERGAVRKIHVARLYAIAGAERRIQLHCRACGALEEVDCDAAFDALAALAERHGFSATRAIVEVPGLCRACAAGE